MDVVFNLALGLALSAACGFRVFVPLLVISAASLTGHVTLAEPFTWIGSPPALIVFSAATVAEIAAYYIPWMDNFLDTLATPAAVVAGMVVAASVMTEMSPLLRWSLAIIAGGGVAGVVQGTTVVARGTSSVTTAGLGNPVVSTVEAGSSLVTSVMAIVWPVLALLSVALMLALCLRGWRWRRSTVAARS